MRRILFAIAAVIVSVEAAQAQWNAPPPHAAPAAAGGNVFGWNPSLKRSLFWWQKDSCGGGCNTCGNGGPGYPGTPAAQMPGTLVFPQHPYVRSPRDFFMAGPSK
jgi:hypothetical protein